mgnify:CR=1 FL=1
MLSNKIVDIVATVFLFLGFLLALSPHATHIPADHSVYHSHAKEITVGLIIGISSLLVLVYHNKALKTRIFNKH